MLDMMFLAETKTDVASHNCSRKILSVKTP